MEHQSLRQSLDVRSVGLGGGAKHFEAKKELKHGKAKNDYWRSKTRNP